MLTVRDFLQQRQESLSLELLSGDAGRVTATVLPVTTTE